VQENTLNATMGGFTNLKNGCATVSSNSSRAENVYYAGGMADT